MEQLVDSSLIRLQLETRRELVRANFSAAMMRSMQGENSLVLYTSRRRAGLRGRGETANVVRYIPYGLKMSGRSRTGLPFLNYITPQWYARYAVGMSRLSLFFSELVEVTNQAQWNASHVGVHMLFQDPAALPEAIQYRKAVANNFGTTQNGVTLEGYLVKRPLRTDIWQYDMHTIPAEGVFPGLLQVSTPLVQLGGAWASVVEQLREHSLSVLPQNHDSREANDYRFINVFLVLYSSVTGGGGPDSFRWLTAQPAATESAYVNPKALWTPARSSNLLCAIECFMYALFLRRASVTWADAFIQHLVRQVCDRNPTRERKKMRDAIARSASKFASVMREKGLELNLPLCAEDAPEIAVFLGFQSCSVLGSCAQVLCGDKAEVKRTLSQSHVTLFIEDNHYGLVLSYTALLPVVECEVCCQRFHDLKRLAAHVKAGTCLTCECVKAMKEYVKPFKSIEAWRHHRAHLEEVCLFRTRPDLIKDKVSKRQRDANRFPHDQDSKKWYDKWKKPEAVSLREVQERCLSEVRNDEEALFVDIESVVPVNDVDVTRDSMLFQEAYAVGWLRLSEAVLSEPVTIEYGQGCMQKFIEYLDGWWDTLFCDEVDLWMRRAAEDLALDCIPLKTKRQENYAFRIRRSWMHVMERGGRCPQCGDAVTELHGWSVEANKFRFSACSQRQWASNTARKNMAENFNDNAPRVSVWAHNGGRYDWLFFHRTLMELGKLELVKVRRGNARYYELQYRGVFMLRDSLNFIMGSLDKLGKDFGAETLKGIFPYTYMSGIERIYDVLEEESNIRGLLPASKFEVSDVIEGVMGLHRKRAMREDEYAAFMEERGWVYDVRKETEKYLAADVYCLQQVVCKFRQGWKSMPFSPELFRYMTIGQMCHSYFLDRYVKPRTYCLLDTMEDAFIRQALYGGRTEVFCRVAPEGVPVHYVDVNSLYPYVMESRLLPGGEPSWYLEESDARLIPFKASQLRIDVHAWTRAQFDAERDALNSQSCSIYGFVEVDVECKQDMEFPILPERLGDKNAFTNVRKTKMVYYTEELKYAIERGYVVTRLHAFCQWAPTPVYAPLIQVLKAEKMRGEGKDLEGRTVSGAVKNPSLRAAAKVAQNALYGKSIQFINESVAIVDNHEDLFEMIHAGKSDVTVMPIYRSDVCDAVEVTIKSHEPHVQKRSCSAIGTAILAEARMVLYGYMEEVQRVGGSVLYCDTDSIVFSSHTPLPASCVDDAVYGKMKVEIPSEDILPGGFVALAPKCYAFNLTDGSPYLKCKGVSMSANVVISSDDDFEELLAAMEDEVLVERAGELDEDVDVDTCVAGLSYSNIKALVTGEKRKVVTRQMQFLKTRDRRVAMVDSIKLVKDAFDKRRLLLSNDTAPWTDRNLHIMQAIHDHHVAYVSDFLQASVAKDILDIRQRFEGDAWFKCLYASWLDSDDFNACFIRSLSPLNV